MRKNIYIIIFILIAIAAATLWTSYHSRPSIIVGQQTMEQKTKSIAAPDFQFTAKDKKYSLADFKGKIVILHFWATWCPPCIQEFPKLVKIAKDMDKDIVVLAISSDKSSNAMNGFTGKFPLSPNFHIIQDKNRAITHDLYQTFAYPETILIDRNGIMIKKVAGDADWTSPDMRSMLQALADKQ